MPDDNRISIVLTDEIIAGIKADIDAIRAKLPFLRSLSNQDRVELPKMGDKSIGFDEKCAAFMKTNPEFLPGFVDPAEVDKDRTLRGQLMEFAPEVQTLARDVEDTLMIVTSEIWMANLAYYGSAREATRRNRPSAGVVYGELRPRFPGGSSAPASGPKA